MVEKTKNQEPAVAQEAVINNQAHRSRSGLWIGIIILLIVLGIAGAGFYLLQQIRSEQHDLGGEINKDDMRQIEISKQITSFQSHLATLQSQLATLDDQVAGQENHYNKKLDDFLHIQQEKLTNVQREFRTEIKKIQRQLGKTRGDWLIADAEYLLSVANARLHLIGDLNTTREALKAADHRLRESGDAAAFKVREQIAQELNALEKVQAPDIVGIYATVKLLEDSVDKLSILLPYVGKKMTETAHHHPKSAAQHEHDLLDTALLEMQGLITIRHTEMPVKAILTEEQAQFIRQQLLVKLEMVKISLVKQNDTLYKASLADAKQWMQQNFTQNADADDFVKGLDKLKAVAIRSQFPDISRSLKMLREITKLRIETDKALMEERPKRSQQAATQTRKSKKEKLQIVQPHAKQPDKPDTSGQNTPPAQTQPKSPVAQ